MYLDPIPAMLHDDARERFEKGDIIGFLILASNEHSLELVDMNTRALRAAGLYEQALIHAFTATRTNNYAYRNALRPMFELADRARLLACGDPLPSEGPFTLYRGVAGRGSSRMVRGLSWTSNREKAQWFANRFFLPDPAVFVVTVEQSAVLFYSNDRSEDEYVVLLPATARPKRIT